MDFSMDRETEALRERVRVFLEEVVIPREREAALNLEGLETLTRELQEEARRLGLFLPHMPRDLGGLGLSWQQLAVVLEEAGRSLLGPRALNAAAPDEGNMHLLHKVANPEQRRRYLYPLAEGSVRSGFAMTEPMGAGADPTLLQATARRRGRAFVLEGRKWFTTGADGAAFFIVLARAEEGPTMFLVDRENPGLRLVRTIPTMDHWSVGGHGELVLEGCEVGEDAVLGEVGKGFEYAELRLDPARLTHCMRWLGVGVRATELAQQYALVRDSFGRKLAEHQAVQFMIADSHMELHAARLMVWHAAWKLDRGERIRHEASMAKVFVAEAVGRAVDRAVQITGGLGISEDIPLSILYRERVEGEILPEAQRFGVGLVVWSPLAMGMLTGRYDQGIPEDSRFARYPQFAERFLTEDNRKKVLKLKEVADELGLTRTQLALAWVLRLPEISSAITGATRPEQIRESLGAAGVNLPKEALERIEAILKGEA